jgi:anti-sigma factor RsiW
MKHVSDTEWNEYVAQTCKPRRRTEIDAHVKLCPACRAAMQETLALHDILGQWQVSSAGHDIAQTVTQAVQSGRTPVERSAGTHPRRFFWAAASRIAATVIIGFALGHLSGRNSANEYIAKRQGTAMDTVPAYIAGLDLKFASDLIWLVLEESPAQPEGAQ